jgi:hypothetical protein
MKDLRALLIDCRIELRKVVRDFQKTELCERLDLAIQTLANAPAAAAPVPAAAAAKPVEEEREELVPTNSKRQTASQVALAWQTAARDIKFSDPALYERMSEKVMRLLGAKALVDPVTELKQLGDELAALRAKGFEEKKSRMALENERDALLGALATAVPQLSDGGDRIGVALARIDWLKAQVAPAKTSSGSSRADGPPAPPPEGPIPGAEILNAVANGQRGFSKEQREWSVGEAMVLSGFQYTPVELIDKGDAYMARIIIDARKG